MTRLIDHLNFTKANLAATSAFKMINAVQDERKSDQLAGAAVLFKTMCEEFQADPREVLGKADLMIRDANQYYRAEVRALGDYIREELLK